MTNYLHVEWARPIIIRAAFVAHHYGYESGESYAAWQIGQASIRWQSRIEIAQRACGAA